MSDVLALDPSIGSAGVALFRGSVLVAAAVIKRPVTREGKGARCLAMARDVANWYKRCYPGVVTIVYEWPQIYTAAKSKGDPNDLPGLAAIGLAVAALVPHATLLTPTPAEWIGQVRKATRGDPWDSPRGRRIKSRLTQAEFACVPRSHDALDAVGLGLHALGRLDPVRIFPGAT